jgi:hypothetical protein
MFGAVPEHLHLRLGDSDGTPCEAAVSWLGGERFGQGLPPGDLCSDLLQ